MILNIFLLVFTVLKGVINIVVLSKEPDIFATVFFFIAPRKSQLYCNNGYDNSSQRQTTAVHFDN